MNQPQNPFPDMPSGADLQRLWRKLKPVLTIVLVTRSAW
jgi:hypothetical protein